MSAEVIDVVAVAVREVTRSNRDPQRVTLTDRVAMLMNNVPLGPPCNVLGVAPLERVQMNSNTTLSHSQDTTEECENAFNLPDIPAPSR